jgi:hypothetical protein
MYSKSFMTPSGEMSEVKYTGAPSSEAFDVLEQLKNKKALIANKINVIFFIKIK